MLLPAEPHAPTGGTSVAANEGLAQPGAGSREPVPGIRRSSMENSANSAKPAECRFCGSRLTQTFVDLGMSPLCESYIPADAQNLMEPFYPLHVHVCDQCFLVQLQEYVSPDHIFTEYAYFSSYSDSWLAHAEHYVEAITRRLGLTRESKVIELASNDGYLLQYFVKAGIPVLGVEPAANVAAAAQARGVPTLVAFFGARTAEMVAGKHGQADLVIGNNVLAQVPNVNDFVKGVKIALKQGGVTTFEFPHLMNLIDQNQFDTIYHEHFSYFSFIAAEAIFAKHGLVVFDVEEIPTHGGSLRIFARHTEDSTKPVGHAVNSLRQREECAGYRRLQTYASFGENVKQAKRKILQFMIDAKQRRKTIAGYGAPGKGNTLLNYCGIRTDFIDYTVDRNPYKQGKYLPGTRIPIFDPGKIMETRPDYLFILPWNFKEEIMAQMSVIRTWGGMFVIPIPEVAVLP
jgi:2-polyprenyl-3-methyl-5-hydroxy-6-metoxy-1,4-benzoquinol methylase